LRVWCAHHRKDGAHDFEGAAQKAQGARERWLRRGT
jgi:hypothetical protein